MTIHDTLLRNLLLEPRAEFPRLVYADYLDEAGQYSAATMLRQKKPVVTVTALERQLCAALTLCRFLPGSYAKLFVFDVCPAVITGEVTELTIPQLSLLWKLVLKFRRQVNQEILLHRAQLLVGPVEEIAQWLQPRYQPLSLFRDD